MSNVTIREAKTTDASAICEIYNYYVLHSTITFEEVVVSVEDMEKRISDVTTNFPWLVAELNGQVVGYAYASKWGSRSSYRYSVEGSIYLSTTVAAKGIGYSLYFELINLLKKQQIHTLVAGIALPNLASLALHKKLGFEPVAHFKEVGYKQEKWIDVVYWQLFLQ